MSAYASDYMACAGCGAFPHSERSCHLCEASGDPLAAAEMTRVDQDRFGQGEGNCFAACVATITGLDLAMLTDALGCGDGSGEAEHWFDRAARVLGGHGWTITYDTTEAPAGACIASGPAVRGLLHSCVAWNGVVVHDPHPSRAGLLEVTDYITLTPTPPPAPEGA